MRGGCGSEIGGGMGVGKEGGGGVFLERYLWTDWGRGDGVGHDAGWGMRRSSACVCVCG